MKDPITALEISHKYLKIVFGYVKDNQVIVNYVRKIPLSHPLENGVIKDHLAIVKELSKNNPVIDNEYHFNRLIDNAILILPPYGLEIYNTTQLTSVISRERIIGYQDIVNIYSIISNKKLPVDNELIDIIPEVFTIDNGEKYAVPPIGKNSRSLNVSANVFTLPRKLNNEYTDYQSADSTAFGTCSGHCGQPDILQAQ